MTDDDTAAPARAPDDENLFRLVPRVLRARRWRLYTEGGRRLADLWQYGGRALLGHNPPGMLRAIKNEASRGLFAPFPHFTEGRLLKALAALFGAGGGAAAAAPALFAAAPAVPPLAFRLYADEASLRQAEPLAAQAGLWRPFLEIPSGTAFVPVLPFPFPGAPAVLAFDPAAESALPPPPPPLPPAALAAAARCVWDLIAAAGERSAPHFPRLGRILARSSFWRRNGIYLTPVSGALSPALFRRFLEGGFLLPPVPGCPVILPGELSPGEEAKLAALLQESET
jgi:hypothetical protein